VRPLIHGQDDEAARKWAEFQNQPTVGTTAAERTGAVNRDRLNSSADESQVIG